MNTRVLAVLLVLGACGDDNGELPPPDPWPGAVTWSWTFSDGGPCPAGVTTANIYLASYDRTPFVIRIEPRIVATVPCAAGAATFPLAVPSGIMNAGRDTWVELVTDDDRVFARSQIVNTNTKDPEPAAVIDVPRGWVHASWTLFGAATQSTRTCADLPAKASVQLYESVLDDNVRLPTLAVTCTAGDLWLGLAPGSYDLALGAFAELAYVTTEPNVKLLGKVTFPAQTVTAGATLEIGLQQITLAAY